jgi:hypothetical protein
MAPEYQSELYIDVSCGRYLGYEISVTNMGAALAANVRPKPIMKRAPMNIPTFWEAAAERESQHGNAKKHVRHD